MKKLNYTLCLLMVALNPVFSQQSKNDRLLEIAERKTKEFAVLQKEIKRKADSLGIPVRVEIDEFTTIELQGFVNGFPMYYTSDNIVAAQTISSDKVWPGGPAGLSLTGDGVTLGIWDSGRTRLEHQEFEGRAIQQDGAETNSSHATHVAGTMIAAGIDPAAIGMSNQASLLAHDWNNDDGEMAAAAANGLKVSNHSYGYITGWRWNYLNDGKWTWFGDTTVSVVQDFGYGFYDNKSQSWDEIAYNAPYYLIVKSAGNNRGSGPAIQPVEHWVWTGGTWTLSTSIREIGGGEFGYDCIPYNGVAKNILTVGAVNDIPGGYTNPGDVVMSSFSSWGPTDDGRIKPDIVGNGIGLYSSTSISNTSYGSSSGTSMSAPNVSGSIGLLINHYRNFHGNDSIKAATLKALIIHTADEAGPNPGPDYMFGWGLMNTMNAALLMTNDSIHGFNFNIRELSIAQDETISFEVVAEGNEPLKATMVWTDPPGIPVQPALNPPDLMLVNDIDMRISDVGNTTFFPYILDPANPAAAATHADNFRDNVEVIFIEQPVAGQIYTITITHKGVLAEGVQDFSLILSGISPIIYSCPPPNDLEAQNIGFNEALLLWFPGSGENLWNLEWGETGFEPGTGNLLENLEQPIYSLSGLNHATLYSFYVKAFCDEEDASIWAGPRSFSTICDSLHVDVIIVADTNHFCESLLVTFTASPQNGGEQPVYKWFVNGNELGGNFPIFSYNPELGDVVSCQLISSLGCTTNNPAISNLITITVYENPTVVWDSFTYDTLCINWPAIELSGGIPEGGYYSGPGVVNNLFDPNVAGIGSHMLYYYYTNADGCSGLDSLKVYVDLCTMTRNLLSEENSFKIYPNPAAGVLFIQSGGSDLKIEAIQMFDIFGRMVMNEFNSLNGKTCTVNVSELISGIYTIRIQTNSIVITRKILIK